MIKRQKEIIAKKMRFDNFYKKLCSFLNKKGILEDIKILYCYIYGIPENYQIIEYKKKGKILNIIPFGTFNRFCGFKLDGGIILGNTLTSEKK